MSNSNSNVNLSIKTGINSSIAMFGQITALMWLRTSTNYQYRHGFSFHTTLLKLYRDGGIVRFYRGYVPSVFMGSLCRFGDITIYKFAELNADKYGLSISEQSLLASMGSMLWRINLMPIDTLDVMLQVEGKSGYKILKDKIKNDGIRVLYHGSTLWSISNLVGNFGWFMSYSVLNKYNIEYNNIDSNIRNALLGFTCSSISDLLTNPLRVLKLNRQSNIYSISYYDIYKNIVCEHGFLGLWGRGLFTRIFTHGIQGSVFMVFWKLLENDSK